VESVESVESDMPHPIYSRHHYSPITRCAVSCPQLQRLWLYQTLLDIEHWLRQQAELATGDSRLAARLDRGADQVEQASNRVKELLNEVQE
jgi:hypothetical protein